LPRRNVGAGPGKKPAAGSSSGRRAPARFSRPARCRRGGVRPLYSSSLVIRNSSFTFARLKKRHLSAPCI
jgi:hypothetical protein